MWKHILTSEASEANDSNITIWSFIKQQTEKRTVHSYLERQKDSHFFKLQNINWLAPNLERCFAKEFSRPTNYFAE